MWKISTKQLWQLHLLVTYLCYHSSRHETDTCPVQYNNAGVITSVMSLMCARYMFVFREYMEVITWSICWFESVCGVSCSWFSWIAMKLCIHHSTSSVNISCTYFVQLRSGSTELCALGCMCVAGKFTTCDRSSCTRLCLWVNKSSSRL